MSKLSRKHKVLLGLMAIAFVYLFLILERYEPFAKDTKSLTSDQAYKHECLSLFDELNSPHPKQLYRPPLKSPPAHLMSEFTQNGEMPIKEYAYFNSVYSDADKKGEKAKEVIRKSQVDEYRSTDGTNRKANGYNDRKMFRLMTNYSSRVKDKTVSVIGTQTYWLEAIALDIGASKVTTLDFTRKEYEQKEILDGFMSKIT